MEKESEKASLTYRVAANAVAVSGRVPFSKITSSGLENVADAGPQIIAFSHHNSWDIPALGAVVYRHNRRPIRFMAKEELLGRLAVGPLLRSMQGLPINRENPQINQLKGALDVLQNGDLLGIAPEGGRQRTREVPQLLGGVGFFATRADVAILPVGIAGKELKRPLGPFIPRKLHIHFGEPLHPSGQGKNDRKELDEQLRPALQEVLDTAYDLHPTDFS